MALLKHLLLALLATAAATAKSAVLDLTPDNFDKVVLKSGKPTLVEFFAPWCGHCKTLAPVYEELAQKFEFASNKVQIAKVDADAEKSLGKRFGVQGFPTLKWFDGQNDTPTDYSSGRDLDSLSTFISDKIGVKPKRQAQPESQVVMLTDKNFAEVVGQDKHVLVAFTAPWCGFCKQLAPIYEQLAADFANDDGSVVIAKMEADAPECQKTAEANGITSYPTLKWFSKGSTEGVLYDGDSTRADLITMVNTKAGLHRLEGGELAQTAGLVESLDVIVAKLTGGSALSDVAAAVKSQVAELTDQVQAKYAEYYVKVIDKLALSDGYASKELSRLQGIVSRGGLSPKKRDELQSRINVLKGFVADTAQKAADTGKVVLDTGKKVVSDTGKKVADAGKKVVDTGKKVADAGKKVVDTGKEEL